MTIKEAVDKLMNYLEGNIIPVAYWNIENGFVIQICSNTIRCNYYIVNDDSIKPTNPARSELDITKRKLL